NNNWKLTHQGICFDANGFLIDGQHRLHAIVMAGKSVQMIVAHNRGAAFHDPIDRGRARSLSTILGMRHTVVAAINVMRMFEMGTYVHSPLTIAEAEGVHERHHLQLAKAIEAGKGKLKSGTLAACAWAIPVHERATMDFAKKVATGEMIAGRDPAYALRG